MKVWNSYIETKVAQQIERIVVWTRIGDRQWQLDLGKKEDVVIINLRKKSSQNVGLRDF